MKAAYFMGLAALIFVPFASAAPKRPISFNDLMQIKRISDPEVSPDGKWVAFVISEVALPGNKMVDHIWLVPAKGGEPKGLTTGEGPDTTPRWSPDGKSIAFLSGRKGKSQIWVISASGGEARRVTSISTEVDDFAWAAKGDRLVFISKVFPDCQTDACNRQRLQAAAASKVKAWLITSLLFRHWDAWRDRRYNHVFTVRVSGGSPRDLTPGSFQSPHVFSRSTTAVCHFSGRDRNLFRVQSHASRERSRMDYKQ
jgi:dipeptidyl aminopeptidase/acylaminoacyl peptidase